MDAAFEEVNVHTARWVSAENQTTLSEFRDKYSNHLALDAAGMLVYLAPSRTNLALVQEKFPQITLASTREHSAVTSSSSSAT